MHCPHCRFEVVADFQFCPKCGNKLSRDCPQCGYVCPLEFRYCPKCGTEIAKATTVVPESAVDTGRSAAQVDLPPPARPIPEVAEAERRPVTVLFADVVGFTSLAEQLDPEELRSLMMGCFQTLAEEIRRYDGFIEKFIGDAIVAVFGAPVAHEDDPERAVRAGLRILEAIDELNSADAGLELEVRVGINTGEAVVALRARAERGEGIVAGDVVNTAARLQG